MIEWWKWTKWLSWSIKVDALTTVDSSISWNSNASTWIHIPSNTYVFRYRFTTLIVSSLKIGSLCQVLCRFRRYSCLAYACLDRDLWNRTTATQRQFGGGTLGHPWASWCSS
jgi:hypothetical protein